MDIQERNAWLQLALTPYIGPETFLKLLHYFGSVQAVLSANIRDIKPFLAKQQAIKYWHHDVAIRAAEQALRWIEQVDDACLLFLSDDRYPVMLAEGLSPPPVLFVRGNIDCLNKPAVAVVGSRHATPQAMRITRDFSYALAQKNIIVVSGMADGIDTAAHQGALTGRGNTVAVWGTGIDRVYPAANKNLARDIAQQGCILSEFPLGTRAFPSNFPRRNRIIAGLCQATLVVEAALDSGSLITARLAMELGREVMAIPGSIDNVLSKGCHALIKQGAKLVECLDDILQECPALLDYATMQYFSTTCDRTENHVDEILSDDQCQQALSTEQKNILHAMSFDPIHPDELILALGMNAADVYAELLTLELAGWVGAVPGGRFQRMKS